MSHETQNETADMVPPTDTFVPKTMQIHADPQIQLIRKILRVINGVFLVSI